MNGDHSLKTWAEMFCLFWIRGTVVRFSAQARFSSNMKYRGTLYNIPRLEKAHSFCINTSIVSLHSYKENITMPQKAARQIEPSLKMKFQGEEDKHEGHESQCDVRQNEVATTMALPLCGFLGFQRLKINTG